MLDLVQAQPHVEDMAAALAQHEQFLQARLASPAGRVLVNCATPLTNAQTAALEKQLGCQIIEVNFPARFNLELPLRPQVNDLARKIHTRLHTLGAAQLDYLIPPVSAPAAHLLAELFTRADPANPVGLVWLRRLEGGQVSLGGVE